MIQEWRETQLNELIDIKHGFAFKGEYFTDEPTNDLLLTPGNFSVGGGFQWGKYKFYDGPIPTEYILTEGDLVVSMTDLSKAGDTLGYSAMVPPSEYLLLHNQRIGKVIKKSESIDALYLNYQLRTKTYRNEVLASATGSTVRHTSPAKIGAYRFLLPPLDEQKAIASVLSALDDKIENNRRMNETLEEMARAIFKSWFVDFDPVHAKASGNAPAHMDAETAALFPSSFGDDGLPVGWLQKKVSEIFDFTMGQSPPGSTYNEEKNGIPFWQGRRDFGFRFPSDRVYCTAPTRFADEDDTLISVRAPVGDVNRALERSCIGRGVAALMHKSKLASYTYYTALQLREQFKVHEASGTVFGSINKTEFGELKVVLSDGGIEDMFEGLVLPLDKKILNNHLESETLESLRDTLLPKLMSGEIRVADAEREVEAAI
ncbi:MAG: restriction endonuclease subunit S [Pseudomonadales bacterium]